MILSRKIQLAAVVSTFIGFAGAHAGCNVFTFTGAVNNDFFNVLNWEDGADMNPAEIVDSGTSRIELCLSIDDDAVMAGATVEFGTGSLRMSSGSSLDVSLGEMVFRSGSSLDMNGATVNVAESGAGQFDMFTGSMGSIVNSMITAADDITFRGNITLDGVTVSSSGDDIEFWENGTLNISGSNFTTDPAQVTFFKDPSSGPFAYALVDSTITTGRVSIENEVTVTLLDSVINAAGDIEESLDGDSANPGRLVAQGTTSITADQLEHSIQLVLEDASVATFTDDTADGDGDSWILNDSTVTLSTVDNRINVLNAFATDARGALVDGRSGLTYADNPAAWNPNDWDGMAALNGRLVPEPSLVVLLLVGALGLRWRRRR